MAAAATQIPRVDAGRAPAPKGEAARPDRGRQYPAARRLSHRLAQGRARVVRPAPKYQTRRPRPPIDLGVPAAHGARWRVLFADRAPPWSQQSSARGGGARDARPLRAVHNASSAPLAPLARRALHSVAPRGPRVRCRYACASYPIAARRPVDFVACEKGPRRVAAPAVVGAVVVDNGARAVMGGAHRRVEPFARMVDAAGGTYAHNPPGDELGLASPYVRAAGRKTPARVRASVQCARRGRTRPWSLCAGRCDAWKWAVGR